MNGRLVRRVLAGGLVSLAACALLIRAVDAPATIAHLQSIDARWLLLPLAALGFQFAIRSYRWATLLTSATGAHTRTWNVMGPLAAGYLANAVLPGRLGEVVRAVLVSRREHLAIAGVVASIVVERVVDLCALISLGLLSTGAIEAVGAGALAASASLVVGVILLSRSGSVIRAHMPRQLPAPARLATLAFVDGVAGIRTHIFLAAYGLSVVAWMGDVLIFWACGRALGIDLSPAAVTAIAVGAALGTAVPAASGYLGTYELGAVTLGSVIGMPADTVLAVALLAHLFAVVPMALLGTAASLHMGWRVADGVTQARVSSDARALGG